MSGQTEYSPGWFCASRGELPMWLLEHHPEAFKLAYAIGNRARWNPDAINPNGLSLGEALIGDYATCGIETEQKYRTAKATLERLGIAAFKPTNKGTIARLCNRSLFFTLSNADNGQQSDPHNERSSTQPTVNQQAGSEPSNRQPTTKNSLIASKSEERKSATLSAAHAERELENPEVTPADRESAARAATGNYESLDQKPPTLGTLLAFGELADLNLADVRDYFADTERRGWFIKRSTFEETRSTLVNWPSCLKRYCKRQADKRRMELGYNGQR